MSNWPFMLGQTFDPFGGMSDWFHAPEIASGFPGYLQMASVPMLANEMFSYRDPNTGWGTGGLRGAASGYGVGSMFGGPVPGAIGAGLGYVSGKK